MTFSRTLSNHTSTGFVHVAVMTTDQTATSFGPLNGRLDGCVAYAVLQGTAVISGLRSATQRGEISGQTWTIPAGFVGAMTLPANLCRRTDPGLSVVLSSPADVGRFELWAADSVHVTLT